MVESKITAVGEEDSTLVLTVSEVRNFIGGPSYSTVHISTPHIESSHEMRPWLCVQYQSLRLKARVYQHLSVWRTITHMVPTCSVLHLAEQRSICTLHVSATLMHYNQVPHPFFVREYLSRMIKYDIHDTSWLFSRCQYSPDYNTTNYHPFHSSCRK